MSHSYNHQTIFKTKSNPYYKKLPQRKFYLQMASMTNLTTHSKMKRERNESFLNLLYVIEKVRNEESKKNYR